MADRFPLIANSSANQIQEIASGDQLNLSGNNIANAGIVTATTFVGNLTGNPTGSGANLTNLPAANLTGTLPAISGANLTNLPAQATIANNADNRVITGGSGVNLNGEANITFDGTSLNLLDHKNIYLGTGNDLRIWHDANNSYSQISGQNHSLYIDGATTYMRTSDGSSGVENAIVMNSNGSVDLYHSGTKKVETTSVGMNITGQSTFIQNSGDVNLIVGSTNAGGAYIVLDGDSNGDAAGGDYAYLYHDTSGNFNIIADNPAGNSELRFYSGSANLRWKIDSSGNFLPTTNNAHDIGTSSYRVRNIYTNDLNLSNEGGSNDVDGTWGNYTIQEGEDDLFLINRRSGKKYKFNLTEVS